MKKRATWAVRIVFAGLSTGSAFVACRHPAPMAPLPNEAPPLAQRPDIAKPPIGAPSTSVTPGRSAPAPSGSETHSDATGPTPMYQQLGAVPAAANVAPDAGIDGGADLPPLPDAGPTVLHDAGTPMRR
jgi:hypothetical protein